MLARKNVESVSWTRKFYIFIKKTNYMPVEREVGQGNGKPDPEQSAFGILKYFNWKSSQRVLKKKVIPEDEDPLVNTLETELGFRENMFANMAALIRNNPEIRAQAEKFYDLFGYEGVPFYQCP
jgi:hypothetical protein